YRSINRDMSAPASVLLSIAPGGHAFDVVGEFPESSEESAAFPTVALDPRYRIMYINLHRAGNKVERRHTVLALGHQQLPRRILLPHDRARKLVPDLFAYGGKVGNGRQLVG